MSTKVTEIARLIVRTLCCSADGMLEFWGDDGGSAVPMLGAGDAGGVGAAVVMVAGEDEFEGGALG